MAVRFFVDRRRWANLDHLPRVGDHILVPADTTCLAQRKVLVTEVVWDLTLPDQTQHVHASTVAGSTSTPLPLLEQLDLPPRLVNLMGIRDIDLSALLAMSQIEFLDLPNIGRTTLKHTQARLARRGLTLRLS